MVEDDGASMSATATEQIESRSAVRNPGSVAVIRRGSDVRTDHEELKNDEDRAENSYGAERLVSYPAEPVVFSSDLGSSS